MSDEGNKKFSSKIHNDLEDKHEFSPQEAYKKLRPFCGEDDSRSYLKGVYFEDGIACATNAHVMACVNVDTELDQVLVDSAGHAHKSDNFLIEEDGTVEVLCGHSNDKSGKFEPITEEYPNIGEVYPDDTVIGHGNDYGLAMQVKYVSLFDDFTNKKNRIDIYPFLSDNGIESDNPVKVETEQAIGVIMPLRRGDD
jgi:hypothetical protein